MNNLPAEQDYSQLLNGISELIEDSSKAVVVGVNSIIVATYWDIGRRIVEVEQGGKLRADYGKELIPRLSIDLKQKFGRGYSENNLLNMRRFYVVYSEKVKSQTPSVELDTASQKSQTPSVEFDKALKAQHFSLNWSHYVRLIRIKDPDERAFYEDEAFRGGWTDKELKRQIDSQIYTRILLSKNKAEMLEEIRKGNSFNPQLAIRSPYVLEFLNLKDNYSESELEDQLITQLSDFLLELGPEYTYKGRQQRIRVGDSWFRSDLVFFNRVLQCLVIFDLKLGEYEPDFAGQMLLYRNFANKHWKYPHENPTAGVILCPFADKAVVEYSLEGLESEVMVAEYMTHLPDRQLLVNELRKIKEEVGERKDLAKLN